MYPSIEFSELKARIDSNSFNHGLLSISIDFVNVFFFLLIRQVFLDKRQWIGGIPIEIVLKYSKKRSSFLNNTNMLHLRRRRRREMRERKKTNKNNKYCSIIILSSSKDCNPALYKASITLVFFSPLFVK